MKIKFVCSTNGGLAIRDFGKSQKQIHSRPNKPASQIFYFSVSDVSSYYMGGEIFWSKLQLNVSNWPLRRYRFVYLGGFGLSVWLL